MDATWEDFEEVQLRFPEILLGDRKNLYILYSWRFRFPRNKPIFYQQVFHSINKIGKHSKKQPHHKPFSSSLKSVTRFTHRVLDKLIDKFFFTYYVYKLCKIWI